jgi:hypothetical protein
MAIAARLKPFQTLAEVTHWPRRDEFADVLHEAWKCAWRVLCSWPNCSGLAGLVYPACREVRVRTDEHGFVIYENSPPHTWNIQFANGFGVGRDGVYRMGRRSPDTDGVLVGRRRVPSTPPVTSAGPSGSATVSAYATHKGRPSWRRPPLDVEWVPGLMADCPQCGRRLDVAAPAVALAALPHAVARYR